MLPDLLNATFQDLQDGLRKGEFNSAELTQAYIDRTNEVNKQGPTLRAISQISTKALEIAREADDRRKRGESRGILDGLPIVVKENTNTIDDGMGTTAGTWALEGAVPFDDAKVVKRLREAGAVIFAKTNMTEWNNFRDHTVQLSGWSSRHGQASSAYYPHGCPDGSSSGSGISISVGLAAGAIGTDSDGSISAPASTANIVGLRPTVGLVARAGIAPISFTNDTVGPMTRTVTDAAHILQAIAGPASKDSKTHKQAQPVPDYLVGLSTDALQGRRLGIPREGFFDYEDAGNLDSSKSPVFEAAVDILRSLGAVIFDPANFDDVKPLRDGEAMWSRTWWCEFKEDMASYLKGFKSIPSGVRTLKDLIAFNQEHPELANYGNRDSQRTWEASEAMNGRAEAEYQTWLEADKRCGTETIDGALKKHDIDAFIFPSVQLSGWARAGYPAITVPLGALPADTESVPNMHHPEMTYTTHPNMPYGLVFAGTAWSEAQLLAYAYAFEQATHVRQKVMPFDEAIPKTQLADVIGRR